MSVQINAQRRRVSLHPNNQPSGNKFSATNFPQINFVIARQPAFLLPQTLRLNGTFVLKNDTGDLPVNDPESVANDDNGSTVNNRIGISSVIEDRP